MGAAGPPELRVGEFTVTVGAVPEVTEALPVILLVHKVVVFVAPTVYVPTVV